MDFGDFIISRESPTGEDNRAGSGAFSKFQFMPATAAELARRTAWGAGATPANVKELVMSTPGRDRELFDLNTAGNKAALLRAALPVNQHSILATHRFGPAGGVSVLQAPANMSVAQWVNSVNWGPGVAPEAVIRQNRLDRYANVGDLRRGFLGGPEESGGTLAEAVVTPPQAAAAPAAQPTPAPPAPLFAVDELVNAFAPQPSRKKQRPLFG